MGGEFEEYDHGYFERGRYFDIMSSPHLARGRLEGPLVETLADMIEAVIRPPARILDVGAAYGLLIQELDKRGFDALGIEASGDCINTSPVREKLIQGDATESLTFAELGGFELAVASNLYEHLNSKQAQSLGRHLLEHADVQLAIINKSGHDPTHVTLQGNRYWIQLLERTGWRFHRWATLAARAAYLRRSHGTEQWHRDTLVFVRTGHQVGWSMVRSVAGYFQGRLKLLGKKVADRMSPQANRRQATSDP
jgi:2-polyprenyl-3-methyl-5-hydroxy-6-metoxy-1,4-benzoquinol methylase